VITALAALILWFAAPATEDLAWPQWGGPDRNFAVPARALAENWPSDGPKRLWQRPLGDGLSGIVTDGAMLYTMYRDGANDVVVALEAASGKTKWEARYEAPFNETCSFRLGAVPRAAPLIAGDRLITVSAGGQMNSFDRASGTHQWKVDLLEAQPKASRACGYSASPLAFEDLVITTAGGAGRGVVAVKTATGEVAWRSQDFQNGYSSPVLVDVGGRKEVIVFTYGEVAGLDPRTGALDWVRPHPADQGVNVATPLWGADNLLFVSSAYDGGSRVLRLKRTGDSIEPEEVWANKRVRIHFGNAVRLGRIVYASNGDFGAAPFAAVDVTTGDMIWRDRGVGRSTVIAAGDKLIILSEDGQLVLATPTEQGLTVHARAPVLNETAWTIPTLSGTKLYLRDRTQILAVELGK
jgi:outer membrane protein assembly factor BamB